MKQTWFIIVLACINSVCYGVALDSVGLEKKDNKWFIAHQIEMGETFYALSVRYGVEVEDIMKSNPDVTVLSLGQQILIPYSDLPYFIHVVRPGETLYAISKKYGVNSEDIKAWNNLSASDIQPGDRLQINAVGSSTSAAQPAELVWAVHIVKKGETLYAISKEHQVKVDSIKQWNYLNSNEIDEGMYLRYHATAVVKEEQETTYLRTEPIVGEEAVDEESTDYVPELNSNAVIPPFEVIELPLYEERGMATLIEGSDSNEKFLALHRKAAPGTILMIRNELNNQVVFVRVIGQLPNTGANDKVIVKLSQAAWNNVHAVNNRFRVKVSYFR
jgi:LysM repeat protein